MPRPGRKPRPRTLARRDSSALSKNIKCAKLRLYGPHHALCNLVKFVFVYVWHVWLVCVRSAPMGI